MPGPRGTGSLLFDLAGEKAAYEALWREGNLRWMLAPHQQKEYDRFRAWNNLRQTPERLNYELSQGWLYNNIWMTEWGRRVGKSSLTIIIMLEEVIRFYNRTGKSYQGLFCTTKKEYITDIYQPLVQELCNPDVCHIPEDLIPQYHSSKLGKREGFHITGAGDAYIKLVGLDLNPDATRGKWCDGCWITEAGLTVSEQLEESVVSVIQPQMDRRPHAFIWLESSTPKILDHTFSKLFRPDCQVRGAYSKLTIEDNSLLSKQEIETILAKAGGRHSPKVRREYFCEEVRDSSTLVIPEYDDLKHRINPQSVPTPEFAQAFTAMDPGFQDLCGIVFFHVSNGKIVVEASIGERHLGYDDIAQRVQETEDRLWRSRGKDLHHSLPKKPNKLDLFKDERSVITLAENMEDPLIPPGGQALVYWSQEQDQWCQNPALRITDHNPLLVDALHKHGITFTNAKKGPGSKEDNIQRLRDRFRNDEIIILDNGHNDLLLASLRSGEWDDHHKHFKKTPQLGNLDIISALAYGTRDVNLRYNPNPPKVLNPYSQTVKIPEKQRKELKRKWESRNPILRDSRGRFVSSLSIDSGTSKRDIF